MKFYVALIKTKSLTNFAILLKSFISFWIVETIFAITVSAATLACSTVIPSPSLPVINSLFLDIGRFVVSKSSNPISLGPCPDTNNKFPVLTVVAYWKSGPEDFGKKSQ